MQEKSPDTQSSKVEGFLHNSFSKMNEKTQKPVFWIVIGVFLIMGLTGYWIGSTMVVQTGDPESFYKISEENSDSSTYLLLEVDDLTLESPKLFSIWFIHINNEGKPSLGFTPVVTNDQKDSDDIKLLQDFPLDSNNLPSREFLKVIASKGFTTNNFVIVDQTSISAFINWFSAKELLEPTILTDHTMVQYGQVLRAFCATLASPSERGIVDFPWSNIIPGHFYSSNNLNTVIENFGFLVSPNTPKCEMVPLP
jgi:hypothetical protein